MMLNWYKGAQSVPRKYPPHHYTTTSSLNRWDKAGWIHAFMFFTPNSDPTSECCSRNRDSSDQATFLPIFYCPILVSLCELYPPFPVLIWQEQHPVWSSAAVAHLLQGLTCCAFRDGILHILVVTSGYLSYCCLLSSLTSLSILLWPLTSTRHFRENTKAVHDHFKNTISLRHTQRWIGKHFDISTWLHIYIWWFIWFLMCQLLSPAPPVILSPSSSVHSRSISRESLSVSFCAPTVSHDPPERQTHS